MCLHRSLHFLYFLDKSCRVLFWFWIKEKEEFHKIKNIFNKNLFKKHTQFRNLDPKAIFIVGMPRSGTTLVEQILSSHSSI